MGQSQWQLVFDQKRLRQYLENIMLTHKLKKF